MLNKIKLSHFRQHIDREFVFGDGLNAVRGENEGGKTTILEALFYLLFGVRAMREGLEDIVTYHHPVGKLRVDGEIEHLGVVYTAYRAKSGAEVSFGREKVTGQSEVTAFFEKLLGVDAKLAGKLMFASQKSLAESLSAGPTEAGKMIEDLADFGVFDDIITAIQTTRPCGVTNGAEARVATVRAQLEGLQADDSGVVLEEMKAAVETAALTATAAGAALTKLEAQAQDVDTTRARGELTRHDTLTSAVATIKADLADLKVSLAAALPKAPTGAELTAARAAVEAEKTIDQARRVRATLEKTDTTMLWDEPLDALEAALADVQACRLPLATRRQGIAGNLGQLSLRITEQEGDTRVAITKLEGQLIKESTCSLCQKDLKDVPEVVRVNSAISKEIDAARAAGADAVAVLRANVAELEAEQVQVKEELDELTADETALAGVIQTNQKVELIYAQAGALIDVDRSVVPGRWTWAGPDTSAIGRPDFAGALVLLENKQRAADRAAAQRQEQEIQHGNLTRRLTETQAQLDELDVAAAQAALDLHADLQAKLAPARAAQQQADRALSQLRSDLALRQQQVEQQEYLRAGLTAQLAGAERELTAMVRYNNLIKKVRAARPAITTKLWNIVLASVSKHFSDVRGTPSTITRDDKRFLCNGFPVSGLSGSAEDMLGLAMRVALTRTFLPNANFLQLDEPGSACSDAREKRMLGMLSTLGFGQTVLISHNDLVDSFCDHIITV